MALLVGAVFSALALGACATSDEEAIKSTVENQLSTLGEPTAEELTELATAAGVSEEDLSRYGVDTSAFMQSWLSGYAFEVGAITQNDATATAEVSFTCKQISAVLASWVEEFQAQAAAQGFTGADEVYSFAGISFMSALDSAQPTTTQVTFTLTKTDNTWALDETEQNQQAFIQALVGGGSSATTS